MNVNCKVCIFHDTLIAKIKKSSISRTLTRFSVSIYSTQKKIDGAFHCERNFHQAVGIWFTLSIQPLMEIIPRDTRFLFQGVLRCLAVFHRLSESFSKRRRGKKLFLVKRLFFQAKQKISRTVKVFDELDKNFEVWRACTLQIACDRIRPNIQLFREIWRVYPPIKHQFFKPFRQFRQNIHKVVLFLQNIIFTFCIIWLHNPKSEDIIEVQTNWRAI